MFISFSAHVPFRSYINKAGVEKTVRHEIRFLDSINFMASSLDALAKTLEGSDLKLLRHRFNILMTTNSRKLEPKHLPLLVFGFKRKTSSSSTGIR